MSNMKLLVLQGATGDAGAIGIVGPSGPRVGDDHNYMKT